MKHAIKIGLINNKKEKHYLYGKHISNEIKTKMSKCKKGEKHHFYRKHLSLEHKMKLSENGKGEKGSNHKLTKEQVIKIRMYIKENKLSQTEIGKLFNISQTQVSKIKLNLEWKI